MAFILCSILCRYSGLLANPTSTEDSSARSPTLKSSMMSNSMYNEVRELYIKAAQLAPHNNIDAEVQVRSISGFKNITQ